MDKPLTLWYCDICGEQILETNEGYVVWRTDEDRATSDFKIIHKIKCDRNDHPQSSSLENFLGNNGLSFLLTFLSIGAVKRNLGQTSQRHVKNMDEFVDFIHRVQTPYYEEARRAFHNEDFLNYYADNNEWAPYCQDNLKHIIKSYLS